MACGCRYDASFYAAVRFQKLNHPLIICCIAFYACWGLLLLVLAHKAFKAEKKQKNKVLWLNY